MRSYGKILKNMAALCLLIGLIGLLLPFCKVQTGDTNITLSGWEVLTVSGKTAVTYYKEGQIPDNYVLKEPYTWADVRNGIDLIDEQGGLHKLELCGVLASLPIVFCVLAILFLLLAEGKKTMVLPMICTALGFFEMLILLFGFPALQPYFLIGIYLFTVLYALALILIIIGWITGGYRKPDQDKADQQDRHKDSSERTKRRKRKGHKRRKTKTKKKKEKNDSEKKEKEQEKEAEKKTPKPATGKIFRGTGIYEKVQKDLSVEGRPFLLGTTKEAMESIVRDDMHTMEQIEKHHCMIQYDAVKEQYTMVSYAAEIILLQTPDANSPVLLSMGNKVAIPGGTCLHIANTRHTLFLQ